MTGTTSNISNLTDITSDINSLLDMLNNTEDILTYNTSIEEEIKNYGGSVLYKYNNIIIASEISETFYRELLKNPNVDYIESLPLKRYGGNDSLESTNLAQTISDLSGSTSISIVSGVTNVTTTLDGSSGSTDNKSMVSITTSGTTLNQKGIPPIITNTNITLSANTNSEFIYDILATGTLTIKFEVIKPANFEGTLNIKNSQLVGSSTKLGIYNITLKAINAFGSYTKDLKLTISDPVKITNTNLSVKNRLGSNFSYTIETSGSLPKTYSMSVEPSGITSGLILEGNMISGITLNSGDFNINIGASGLTSSDSKILKLSVGAPPIITSSGILSGSTNTYLEYNITSLISNGVSYTISGNLNDGLSFKINKIDGVPTTVGSRTVTIKATNAFGETTKSLTITIYEMGT